MQFNAEKKCHVIRLVRVKLVQTGTINQDTIGYKSLKEKYLGDVINNKTSLN